MNRTRSVRLEQLKVAAPCPAEWDDMAGGDRARQCEACGHLVHDLAALRRHDAERLLAENSGRRLCVRITRRADTDAVVTIDGQLRRAFATAAAIVLALFGATAGGCRTDRGDDVGATPVVRTTGIVPLDAGPADRNERAATTRDR